MPPQAPTRPAPPAKPTELELSLPPRRPEPVTKIIQIGDRIKSVTIQPGEDEADAVTRAFSASGITAANPDGPSMWSQITSSAPGRAVAGVVRGSGLDPRNLGGLLPQGNGDWVVPRLVEGLVSPLKKWGDIPGQVRAGNFTEAGKSLVHGVPIAGPALESVEDRYAEGDVAGAMGEVIGNMVSPAMFVRGAKAVGRGVGRLPRGAAVKTAEHVLDTGALTAEQILKEQLLRGGPASGVRKAEAQIAEAVTGAKATAPNMRYTPKPPAGTAPPAPPHAPRGRGRGAAPPPAPAAPTPKYPKDVIDESEALRAEANRLAVAAKRGDIAPQLKGQEAIDLRRQVASMLPASGQAHLGRIDALQGPGMALNRAAEAAANATMHPMDLFKPRKLAVALGGKTALGMGAQQLYNVGTPVSWTTTQLIRAAMLDKMAGQGQGDDDPELTAMLAAEPRPAAAAPATPNPFRPESTPPGAGPAPTTPGYIPGGTTSDAMARMVRAAMLKKMGGK